MINLRHGLKTIQIIMRIPQILVVQIAVLANYKNVVLLLLQLDIIRGFNASNVGHGVEQRKRNSCPKSPLSAYKENYEYRKTL